MSFCCLPIQPQWLVWAFASHSVALKDLACIHDSTLGRQCDFCMEHLVFHSTFSTEIQQPTTSCIWVKNRFSFLPSKWYKLTLLFVQRYILKHGQSCTNWMIPSIPLLSSFSATCCPLPASDWCAYDEDGSWSFVMFCEFALGKSWCARRHDFTECNFYNSGERHKWALCTAHSFL